MASVAKREWTYKSEAKSAWVVRYVDDKGIRRSKQFDKKKDADRYRVTTEGDLQNNAHVAESETPWVRDLAEQFIRDVDRRWQDGRIGEGRRAHLIMIARRYVVPAMGHVRIGLVGWRDLERARDLMIANRVAPVTQRLYFTGLAMVEEFARRRGYTKRTPIADYRKEMGVVERKPIQTFTMDEVIGLLQVASLDRKHAKRRSAALTRCFVHLAAFSMLRWGEIAGLTLDNLDLDGRTIHVRHNLTEADLHKGPKTRAGVRDIPMPAHVADMLREWISTFYAPNERRLVFRKSDGAQLTPSNFRNAHWYPLLVRAGLNAAEDKTKRHFHALRHFGSSLMAEKHLPLPEIAALMGHARFDMTLQTYVHPIVGGARRSVAVDAIAAQTLALTDARTQTSLQVIEA